MSDTEKQVELEPTVENTSDSQEEEDEDDLSGLTIEELGQIKWSSTEKMIAALIHDAVVDGRESVALEGDYPLPNCVKRKLERQGFLVHEEELEEEVDEDDDKKSTSSDDSDDETEIKYFYRITIIFHEFDEEDELLWKPVVEDDEEFLE